MFLFGCLQTNTTSRPLDAKTPTAVNTALEILTYITLTCINTMSTSIILPTAVVSDPKTNQSR